MIGSKRRRNACGHKGPGFTWNGLTYCGSCVRTAKSATGTTNTSKGSGPQDRATANRPCPRHPGYVLRGGATQCAHPLC